MVPSTETSSFTAGELGKSGRNLEEIGTKCLGPNRFGVVLKKMAERLLTFAQVREYWKTGSELGNV